MLASVGYDYFEPAVTGVLKLHERRLRAEEVSLMFANLPIMPEVFNCFVPGTMRITGPDVDFAVLRSYVEQVTIACGAVGCKVIVFGSGGARKAPDGFDREQAYNQLVEFLKMAGDECAKRGITLAIEPLNKTETNIINSVEEAVQLADRADYPAVRVLADYYHIATDNQPLTEVSDAGGMLAHCHMAEPRGRVRPATGMTDYAPWFKALRDAGYDRRCSLECKWDNLAQQAGETLEFLKSVAASVEE